MAKDQVLNSVYVCFQPSTCLNSGRWKFWTHYQGRNPATNTWCIWQSNIWANKGSNSRYSNMDKRSTVFVHNCVVPYKILAYPLTENESLFFSKCVLGFPVRLGIKPLTTTVYPPQIAIKVEQFNRTIIYPSDTKPERYVISGNNTCNCWRTPTIQKYISWQARHYFVQWFFGCHCAQLWNIWLTQQWLP